MLLSVSTATAPNSEKTSVTGKAQSDIIVKKFKTRADGVSKKRERMTPDYSFQ